jgi:hypothetical protein
MDGRCRKTQRRTHPLETPDAPIPILEGQVPLARYRHLARLNLWAAIAVLVLPLGYFLLGILTGFTFHTSIGVTNPRYANTILQFVFFRAPFLQIPLVIVGIFLWRYREGKASFWVGAAHLLLFAALVIAALLTRQKV